MKVRFDPQRGRIDVTVVVRGPVRSRQVRMLLDTGATRTSISPATLAFVGYEASGANSKALTVAGIAGLQSLPLVTVDRVALGSIRRHRLEVVALALPLAVGSDGLLGMDFLSDVDLHINTREGVLELTDLRAEP